MKLLREVIKDNLAHTFVDESAFPFVQEQQLLKEEGDYKKVQKKLKHLNHLEDLPIIGGFDGFHAAISTLQNTHKYLSGGKPPPNFSVQTKFDGYPAVVWGHDPNNGKFFVGTKSYFNKTPKVNYTDKDIDANHGTSERLADKLKFLLKHLKTVSPKEGIFQGDLMYTADEVNKTEDNKLSFTPNTLTYNVDKNSHEGQKIMDSKVGIAAHTHYEKSGTGDMQAVFDIDHSQFKPSKDVHFISPKLRGPFNYKTSDQKKFNDHLSKATGMAKKIANTDLQDHKDLLLSYINAAVRTKKPLSTEGYIAHIHSQYKKRIDSLKTEGNKTSLKKSIDDELKNIIENKKDFETLFQTHGHIQNAKNVLVDVLSKNSRYDETILGEPSKPEGFVANNNGFPTKLIDRSHFSAANFDWNGKVNPEDNPLVLSFGRMNPPTTGHKKMVDKGADIARRIGAKQAVVASGKQDKDNPLTPTQKLSWMKSMFPGKNVSIAGPEQASFVAQLQHFHNQGVKDITIVAGADRVKDFQNILAKYNGAGKLFDFRRARIISAGNRDPEAKGEEGMSASKMRDAAKKDDYKTFKTGVAKHIKEPESQEMFHTLKAQMNVAKIDQSTPGHSLSIYAKRDDKIGSEAKAEIERRKRKGTWKGEMKESEAINEQLNERV